MLIDAVAGLVSLYISYWIRLSEIIRIWPEPIIALVATPLIFYFLGVYRRPWRYTSTSDIWFLLRVGIVNILFLFMVIFIINRLEELPRLVMVINYFVLMSLVVGIRFIYRSISENFLIVQNIELRKVPVLLIGTEDNAEAFIRSANRPNGIYKVIGLIADDTSEQKKLIIRSVPVLGQIGDIENIINSLVKSKNAPERVILASNNLHGELVEKLLIICEKKGLKIGRAPLPTELVKSQSITEIKKINLEDLLGRRQNRLDEEKMKKLIGNKVVMITGSGGTIGKELLNRIKKFLPKKMVLVDSSEYALYKNKLFFYEKDNNIKAEFFCTNVRDAKEVEKLFRSQRPEIILHAAALKHVAICEENIYEAFYTNTLGTKVLADAASKYEAKAMVLISTDKAVDPSSIMGITKRLAELLIQLKDREKKSNKTRFLTVRFGNVLGSTGSVVPLFQKQISVGGPLTVTDKNATRFFMTVAEAVDLVLTSTFESLYNKEFKRGDVMVLEMGRAMKIDHLAKQMIKLAGLVPIKDIKIKYIGLSKGEKLHEKLFNKNEKRIETKNLGILIAESKKLPVNEVYNTIKKVNKHCNNDELEKMKSELYNINY